MLTYFDRKSTSPERFGFTLIKDIFFYKVGSVCYFKKKASAKEASNVDLCNLVCNHVEAIQLDNGHGSC